MNTGSLDKSGHHTTVGDKELTQKKNSLEEPLEIQSPLSPLGQIIKRCLDVVISLMMLIILAPLMLLVALAIKLESEGPIIYKQTRVGKNGREFTFYKFRSMFRDADKRLAELRHLNEADGPIFKIKNDPRITKVGRIIRKTSIDELPQLFNVLKGDMSLVGPRPPLPVEVAQYTARDRQRLNVIPGITCLWQISGRSNIGFDRWVELDLEYIRNQSLWLDLKILLLTIPAVIKGTGAH
ncbi:MAG: sugar transferase [Armatimonadetes bacterium]|nr:sugar transferase [Armatimonadota bacterium]